jgi:hypothetical protein
MSDDLHLGLANPPVTTIAVPACQPVRPESRAAEAVM